MFTQISSYRSSRRSLHLQVANMFLYLLFIFLSLTNGVNSTYDHLGSLNLNHDEFPNATNLACQVEITRICGKKPENLQELDTLECILNERRNQAEEISDSCNHALWLYRKSVTEEAGFLKLTDQDCIDDMKKTNCWTATERETKGFNLVSCLIDRKDLIEKHRCQDLVTRLEGVIFSDYEMIQHFATNCEEDIKSFQCGRNDVGGSQPKKLPHSQGKTIECLSNKLQKLKTKCAVEILRIAELQVDDFHLDRALYFACRGDREKFCSRVQAGNGRVYKCLLRHKVEPEMSGECREQIYRRQKLGWQDYRASGIVSSCRNEIKKYKCRRGVNSSDKNVRLSQILLCLENENHKGQEINGDCLDEIKQHRKALMDDYRVTPEVLSACTADKEKFCADQGIHGKTLHCLMAHAQSRHLDDRISNQCLVELENLLKMSDISGDWRVDPVLQQNCQPVVDRSTCSKYPSEKVLDCLMNLLTSDSGDGNLMTDECEISLIQIQYFLARDFPMDGILFSACKRDAKEICGAKSDWAGGEQEFDSEKAPLVLSCLFRNIVSENSKTNVSPKCAIRVREVMRQRALSVRLMPDIEGACLEDLADICSEKTKPGEELECLQDHLDELTKECRLVVSNFTVAEMKNPTVDPFIWKHCRDIIEDKCSDDKSDDVDAFECLVDLKPEMKNKKCRVSIEHLQLLRLKEVKFSPKFKTQCQSDVIRYCNTGDQQPLTSWKVVSCLSELIRNDMVIENTQRVSKGCRKQVRYLLLSKFQFENSKGDPNSVYSVCSSFVQNLCNGVQNGGGRILECLRNKKSEIPETSECHQALFKVEQEVDADARLDVVLVSECSAEIKLFCPGNQENVLQCLKLNSKKDGFDTTKCGKVVKDRLIEQNSDARLNPHLYKSCKLDVKKFCTNVTPGQGRIIGCLKKVFVNPKSRLTPTCKNYIQEIMERAAKDDVRYDSDLFTSCKGIIENSCSLKVSDSEDKDDQDNGKVEECLKQMFHDDKIRDDKCRAHVAQLIQSTMIDIHVDPLLNQACSVDLVRHCEQVPPGEGRLLNCLLEELKKEQEKGIHNFRLSERCRDLLIKRSELFQLAAPGKMESLQDIVDQVQVSPHKNYFLTTGMSIVGLIFIFGLFCGRATKRRVSEKNK